MKLPNRILFAFAHCDDIELCAGGLLARACYAEGTKVGVLVFSDHRGVLSQEAAERSRAELEENMAWLTQETGASLTNHCGVMMRACRGDFEAERARIYETLEKIRSDYDLVVTHAPGDTNQDHRQVVTEAARVFKAHATVLGGEFPNNDLGAFRADVFVTLTPRELAAKVRMVTRYASQAIDGRPYIDASVVEALARVRGSQVREASAEAFMVAARVVVRS